MKGAPGPTDVHQSQLELLRLGALRNSGLPQGMVGSNADLTPAEMERFTRDLRGDPVMDVDVIVCSGGAAALGIGGGGSGRSKFRASDWAKNCILG